MKIVKHAPLAKFKIFKPKNAIPKPGTRHIPKHPMKPVSKQKHVVPKVTTQIVSQKPKEKPIPAPIPPVLIPVPLPDFCAIINEKFNFDDIIKHNIDGISVIIPLRGFHRHKSCLLCIEYILKQNVNNVEILVIEEDNNIKFDLMQFKNNPNVKHIFLHSDKLFNKSRVVNYGVKLSKYDMICVNDVDMIMQQGYLYEISKLLNDYDGGNIGSNILYLSELPHDEFFYWNGKHWDGDAKFKFHGGNVFFTRDGFIKSGGMNEIFFGHGSEDSEFFDRCLLTIKFIQKRSMLLLHMPHIQTLDNMDNNLKIWNEFKSKPIKDRLNVLLNDLRRNNMYRPNFINCNWIERSRLSFDRHVNIYMNSIPKYVDKQSMNVLAVFSEPEIFRPSNFEVISNYKMFDLILSNDSRILSNCENSLYFQYGTTWINKKDWSVSDKKFGVSFLCGSKDITVGHKMRLRMWNRQNEVTIPHSFWVSSAKPVKSNFNNPLLPIDKNSKIKLFDTCFNIAIENVSQNGYFTEKLIDCFITGTIPIYFGDQTISDTFDINGVFIVKNEDDIIKLCNDLKIDDYNDRIESVKYNYNACKEFCDLESRLQKTILNFISLNKV